jgi:hypothetical protein
VLKPGGLNTPLQRSPGRCAAQVEAVLCCEGLFPEDLQLLGQIAFSCVCRARKKLYSTPKQGQLHHILAPKDHRSERLSQFDSSFNIYTLCNDIIVRVSRTGDATTLSRCGLQL